MAEVLTPHGTLEINLDDETAQELVLGFIGEQNLHYLERNGGQKSPEAE